MKLPNQKKIMREDVKGAPGWINIILDTLNGFMESVYFALNKNLTFQENINSFVKEIEYQTVSTYPTLQKKISIINELKTRPIGVIVFQAYDKNNYTPAPGPVYIPWIETNGNIEISTILGLEADKVYNIRLVIF